jgi:hypothetical protein
MPYLIEEQRDEEQAAASLSEGGSEILEAPTDVIGEIQEELEAPSVTPISAEQVAPEEPDEEEIPSFKETLQEPAPAHIAPDAETYIKQGNYNAAMNTYKTILSEDPENKQVLQRVAELKALLKVLGKDQDAHILELEGFLEGIYKRRDEFFGNT